MLLSAILLICACAATGHASVMPPWLPERLEMQRTMVPDYQGALELVKRNGDALVNLLPHEELTVLDPRRHYVIITGVLAVIVEYLNSDCTPPDYEHQYLATVDKLVPVLWEKPQLAVDRLEAFLKDVDQALAPIQDLSDKYCKRQSQKVCNAILWAITDGMDEYQVVIELLLLLSELATMYESNRYSVEAAQYSEVELLLRGQERLKPLVMKAAEVYDKLYGKSCIVK